LNKNVRNFDQWLKDFLVKENIINESVAKNFELKAKENKTPFHDVVIREGVLSVEEVYQKASSVLTYETIFIEESPLVGENEKIISKRLLEKHKILPISVDRKNKTIKIATANPSNLMALDEVRRETKLNPTPVFAIYSQIIEALEDNESDLSTIMEEMTGTTVSIEETEVETTDLITDKGDEPIVVRMVNTILSDAIQERASDIHIEPMEHHVRVRIRIDGILINKINNLDKKMLLPMISRLKVMSRMDISETRRPQDGRFRLTTGTGQQVDFRTSSMATQYGEKIVLRLTLKENQKFNLDTIGFNSEETEIMRNILSRPYGLILVTGPTGSGKTTTLYGMLGHLNTIEKNIVTIEDPVERELYGVNQTPVNHKAEVTFSTGLRTILRQDPDIVMVGEIRDRETAETTIQASLTGHLVLSTIHTNDSSGSITRLKDMGVDSYKIPSAVLAVLAQRLLRSNCSHCVESYSPTTEELALLRSFIPSKDIPDDILLKRGKGCKHCSQTGYKGRSGVFEILVIDEEIKEAIINNSTASDIRRLSIKKGMKTMEYRGAEQVISGQTTLEELRRVIFVI
jgi:type II secretory ATPase GspE/PulE/Tfp pilus assembly ATPase PilB-like protein